jgi:RNA polymerase sigma factor (sigma-70 family)
MDTRLREFLATRYDDLLALARQVGHPSPEDAVHDLAIKLAARTDQGRLARILGARWKPYVRRGLLNLLLDYHRTDRPTEELTDAQAAPFDEKALRREVVDLARLSLEPGEQAIFEMRYVLDVPVPAIARCTGRSRPTTYRDLSRIRVKLTTVSHAICPDC